MVSVFVDLPKVVLTSAIRVVFCTYSLFCGVWSTGLHDPDGFQKVLARQMNFMIASLPLKLSLRGSTGLG
jgi:hypothetical protein